MGPDSAATCLGTCSTSATTCATVPTATHASCACTTGRCDTVGVFCLRRAKSGGESGYSSALAVYAQIRKIKPELLESFWNDFHPYRFGEQPPGEPPYTSIPIPLFSECDGVTTVILIGGDTWMASDEFDAPFSDCDREALVTFECLAAAQNLGSASSSNTGKRSCSTTARCCTIGPHSRTTTSRT